LDVPLPVQSKPITTNIVSLNPAHGEMYSIQHYVIKFVSDLWLVCSFLRVLHQYNWPPWYYWNIVESGFKHQCHNPYFFHFLFVCIVYTNCVFFCSVNDPPNQPLTVYSYIFINHSKFFGINHFCSRYLN